MTLTTALALAGLLLLLALGLHGWWQTRRAQRQARRRLQHRASTAAPPEPTALRMAPRRVPRLDALIDAIVPLTLEAPISGEMALAHLPPTRRAGSKPFYVEGLDAESGQWEPCTPGHRYGELQAGVQLASRSGALNEIEYSEFVQKVETFAEAVGASADVPDMLEVVARARELDGLAGPLDAQLTVTLRSNGVAWSVGYVQQVAARLGFVTGPVPGRMVLPAAEEGAPPMLVLSVDPQNAAMRSILDQIVARAGAETLTLVGEMLRPGITTEDINRFVHEDTVRRGANACSYSTCRRRLKAPSPSRPSTAPPPRWPTTWTPPPSTTRDSPSRCTPTRPSAMNCSSCTGNWRRWTWPPAARRRGGCSADPALRCRPPTLHAVPLSCARCCSTTRTATTCSTRQRSPTPNTTACSRNCSPSRSRTPNC